MTTASGAYKNPDGELRCRVCGRSLESNSEKIWCSGMGYGLHFIEDKPEGFE